MARSPYARHGPSSVRCDSDGGLQFASHIRAKLDSSSEPLVVLRCDVQNAFGSVHWSAVLQAASQVDPLFAKTLAPWLRRATGAALFSAPDSRELLLTNRGVPQGDPISSVVFSLTLSQALTCLDATPTRESLGTIDAYADDAILCTTPDQAGPAFLRWRDRLQDLGLELKTTLRSGSLTRPNCLPLFSLSFLLPASVLKGSPYVACPWMRLWTLFSLMFP